MLGGSSPGPSWSPLGGCSGQGLPRTSLPMGLVFAQKLPCRGCKGRGRARSLLLPFPPLGPVTSAVLSLAGEEEGSPVCCDHPPWVVPHSQLGTEAVPGCGSLVPHVSLLQGVGMLRTGTSRTKVRPWCHCPSMALAPTAAASPWPWALLLVETISAPLGDEALPLCGPAGPVSTNSTICPSGSLPVPG